MRFRESPRGALRNFVLAIFLFGASGTVLELLLLGHTETAWQWLPLALIASGLLVLLGYAIFRRVFLLRAFQFIMLLCMLSGFVGGVLHLQAKIEFKREVQPDLHGINLLWQVLRGATLPPVLAPGMMVQLGLLGWAYGYAHPELRAAATDHRDNT